MRDLSAEREIALTLAVDLHRPKFQLCDVIDVRATADSFFTWLTAPLYLIVAAGSAVDQATGNPTGNPGGTGMVAMKDSEKFQLTTTAEDAKGQTTAGPTDVTYTAADTNVLTISAPDANGAIWALAGLPGSTVITADWPDSPIGDLQGTLAVDVTAGDAASLQIGAGTPVPQ